MLLYRKSPNALLETFDDGGLVLLLKERHLLELNQTAVKVVELFDGTRTMAQVAEEIAKQHDISENNNQDATPVEILQDVVELCNELHQSGVLELQPGLQVEDGLLHHPEAMYLRNPDVILREEDQHDGAILLNSVSHQTKILNSTAVFIWQQCLKACTLRQIIAEVHNNFEDVPLEQIQLDVRDYLNDMMTDGFIGTIL